MGARCGLADVPRDLFIHYILPHITDNRDLTALRATATGFRDIVTPKLFASYVNIADIVEPKRPFIPFLRTIAARPDLARHCKAVEVRGFAGRLNPRDRPLYRDPDPEPELVLSVQDWNLFVRAATETGIINEHGSSSQDSADKALLDGLAAGNEESQMILTLACLPNLEQIVIHGFPDLSLRSLHWNTFLRRTKHGFSRLSEFSAGTYYGLECAGLSVWDFDEELDFLLRLPCFRLFHGEGVHLDERNPLWDRLSLAAYSVTSLRLHSSEVGRKAANALIRSCKALETFEFSWSCGGGDSSEDQRFFVEDVREALSLHKRSLRTLYLDFRDYEQYEDFRDFSSDWIGSLKDFSKLEYLRIDYPRLVGRGLEHVEHDLSAILPNALQTLSLDYADNEAWAHEVRSDLIRLARSRFCPDIAVVALSELRHDYRGKKWKAVKDVLEDRGLKLRKCDWVDRVEPLSQRQSKLNEQLRKLRASKT